MKAKLARQYTPRPHPEYLDLEGIVTNLLDDVLRLAALAFPAEVAALGKSSLVDDDA